MNKTKHKRQKYKYNSRKAFNKNKYAKIKKSAKNKQPTNLLFKTIKLYKKQKHNYLDKQKGGYQSTKKEFDPTKSMNNHTGGALRTVSAAPLMRRSQRINTRNTTKNNDEKEKKDEKKNNLL